jgi:hypothetical protein
MTDSSSEEREAMADMAGELMAAKMAAASKRGEMTHMLRMGNFHIEIVPDCDIDVEKFFTETMNNLWDRFGKDSLEVKVSGMDGMKPPDGRTMHQ